MPWLNEPERWQGDGTTLSFTTSHGSDFWRKTHYGYVRHSGHVWLERASGDFSASVRVRASYSELYDQAGLMVLADEAHWLKCGVEFTSGRVNIAVVVTNDYSDWSILPLDGDPAADVVIRVTRLGEALMVDYSLDETSFNVIRVAHLEMSDAVDVGPMACSPVGPGLDVSISEFRVGPPERSDDQ